MLNSFVATLPMGLVQGAILALISLAIMIEFRLLDFADLSAEGTYPLGGVMCAVLLTQQLPIGLAMLIACIAGGVVGFFTAFLSLRYRVNSLLSGIILSSMLYSVNLRLMEHRPNIPLFQVPHWFVEFAHLLAQQMLLLTVILAVLVVLLYGFLQTEQGLRFRSVGLNPKFALAQGIEVNLYIYGGVFAANALCAFAGSLMVQLQSYADVGMGIGIVIHALAGMMLGEVLLGTQSLLRVLLSPIIGALVYQQIQGLVLSLGLAPSDLKLLTGLVVVVAILCKNTQRRQSV